MNDKQLKARIRELNRENAKLREENAALTQANAVVRATESLRSLATRAYRRFDHDAFGSDIPEDADPSHDDEGDVTLAPSIVLRLNLAGDPGETWSAQVECFDVTEFDGVHPIVLALGLASSNPIVALDALRDALEEEPGEDGVRVVPRMRELLDAYDAETAPLVIPSGEKPN